MSAWPFTSDFESLLNIRPKCPGSLTLMKLDFCWFWLLLTSKGNWGGKPASHKWTWRNYDSYMEMINPYTMPWTSISYTRPASLSWWFQGRLTFPWNFILWSSPDSGQISRRLSPQPRLHRAVSFSGQSPHLVPGLLWSVKESHTGALQWVRGSMHEQAGGSVVLLCGYSASWWFSSWSFLSLQLVNNPLASQAAAAAAAMGSIASSQAFGNALSSLQGVTGQLVTNAQGQVSGRWEPRVNFYGRLNSERKWISFAWQWYVAASIWGK